MAQNQFFELEKVQFQKYKNLFFAISKIQKFIICYFKNGQKSIFELGEKFKNAKNAISRKKGFI